MVIENRFAITEGAARYGWAVMKRDMFFYAGITLLSVLVTSFVGGMVEQAQSMPMEVPKVMIFMLLFLDSAVSFYFQLVFTVIFLNAVSDDTAPSINDFFVDAKMYFDFAVGTFLYGLIVTIGMILFIVPGIIFFYKYCLYGYFIVDKEYGPIEALKASGEVTEGLKWELAKFIFILGCINLLGVLALGIGILFTVPATGIAFACVYRNLVDIEDAPGTPEEPERVQRDVPIMSARRSK